jgi:hypothetical protein
MEIVINGQSLFFYCRPGMFPTNKLSGAASLVSLSGGFGMPCGRIARILRKDEK